MLNKNQILIITLSLIIICKINYYFLTQIQISIKVVVAVVNLLNLILIITRRNKYLIIKKMNKV